MKVLLLKKGAFLDWYFDYEMKKTFFYDNAVLESLKSDGVFCISIEGLLDSVGFLPPHVAQDIENVVLDGDGEIDMSYYDEIKFA